MPATGNVVLAINAGSSSIKFALYRVAYREEMLLFSGSLENMELGKAKIKFSLGPGNQIKTVEIPDKGTGTAMEELADWLAARPGFRQVTAIGHRVVHGMSHTQPEAITAALIKELKSLVSYDPEHLPAEIALIELFLKKFPDVPQIACFDTMFHHTMPIVAQMLAIPRRYFDKGIRRYGFHGISYQYLTEQLRLLDKDGASNNRLVIAHLGSGASLAAISNGLCVDTSMGFTPGAGIPMSTRSGDLDPGVAAYLLQQEKLSAEQFNHLVNHESGLLGVSETGAEINELLKMKAADSRAAEAVDLFCYQVSKYIGAYAAALGGIDTLVFSGGIGEHLPEVRAQVCQNLGFLGIGLDEAKNLENAAIISRGKVCVRVLPTNEALMMVRLITRILTHVI